MPIDPKKVTDEELEEEIVEDETKPKAPLKKEAVKPKKKEPTFKHVRVRSSNVKSIAYDEPSQTLEVAFLDGSFYRYYDFPKRLHTQFMAAPSKGKFIWQKIRGKFDYEKMV